MDASKPIELFPFASQETRSQFGVPIKSSVILIRWPVVIICSYLLLYPSLEILAAPLVQTFILLYVASNVALYFVNESRFASSSFYSPVVIFDTLVLTLSLVINGHVQTDFYLTYFLLIIICCIFDDPKILTAISVLAPIVYTLLLFRFGENLDPSVLLRLPFLLIISLFYGYFTQLARAEKALKLEAEQRSRGKKEALDIVSHELRTPLNLIGGFAQALKDRVLGEITSEQEQALGKILRQSDILLQMVNSILDLARCEAGELAMQREEVPLSEYLDDIKANYEGVAPDSIEMLWAIPLGLPVITTDKSKLTIILQNLINNAIKFTEAGRLKISARWSSDKQRVEIEVADTGIGIPNEALPIIFEKFRQADGSSTRFHGGVGLGLHIVKIFTELIGGEIEVESEPNLGSTFTLSLPVEAGDVGLRIEHPNPPHRPV
jgi:signal transduction histidine kinase